MFNLFKRLFSSGSKKSKKIVNQAPFYPFSMGAYSYPGLILGSDSGGSKWPYGLSASGRIRMLDHYTLRHNARDAYHDTPQVNAIVERYADSVAYTGLKLECSPKTDILGISLEQAEQWSSRVEEAFDLWAKSKRQHRSETMTWYQAHRLYQIFQQRDNDVFIGLFYSKDRKLLNPLQWEFIDPDQIRGDAFTSTGGPINPGFNDGIVRDDRGREKSYKLWLFNQKDKYELLEIPAISSRSGRRMMLHGYALEYAMQGRGFSRLSRVLQEFENLTDFSLSYVKNAISQAMFSLYVKPSVDEPATNAVANQISNLGAGLISHDNQEVSASDPGYPYVNYCRLPEATFDTPGSVGVFNLQAGQDLKAFQPSMPSQSYEKFVNAFLSSLSSSMSVPLEVLLMKFEQNYSASRAALLMFWQVAMIWRAEMEADCLNPIYEMWLSEEIAAGRIAAPGWSNPYMKAAWLNCIWIGAPMPNIDPQRTAKADQMYVEMGAQTLDQVARKTNGSDGRSNRAKLHRELSELAIPPWIKNKDKDSEEDKDNERS